MRILLCVSLVLMLGFNKLQANEIILEAHYKVSKTFSGEVNNNETFHVIIAKNKETKKHEIIPVSFFNDTLKRLRGIPFDRSPSVVSYHSNNDNVVSLLVSTGTAYPIKKYMLDIDLISGEFKLSKKITDLEIKATLQKEDKQIMVAKKWDDIFIYSMVDADSISLTKVSKSKKTALIFKGINSSHFGAVNTDEFVANGSTSSFKVFFENDHLFFARDYFRYRETSVLKVKVNNNNDSITRQVEEKLFKYDKFNLAKEASSYIHQNNLYQLLLGEKIGYINISDLETGERKSISLLNIEVTSASEGFTTMKSFFKEAVKSKYTSTITVNESVDQDHIIVRCDYVRPDVYGYHYNWWWHNQNFMWQQQMHMNNLPSFGPSQPSDNFVFEGLIDEEMNYFELILNKNSFEISNISIEPKYAEFNKKEYSDKINKIKSFKHVSSVFLEEEFVYFYQDVLSTAFRVAQKSLNND